jgi:hypothetical protein
MSEQEKKKPFWDPNAAHTLKNAIGFLSAFIGFIIAVSFWCLFLVVIVGGDEDIYNLSEFVASLKLDVGLAILLGSTIISGGILLSGIRKG